MGKKAVIFEQIGEGFEDVIETVLGHPPKKKDDKKEQDGKDDKEKRKSKKEGKP